MGEKNSDLLFEYLRSILYDAEVHTLDIEQLDAPFQKLGLGMQYLEEAVAELKNYTAALSKGNLSVDTPPRENFLCENLKNIHSNLNHLTWQAKQVAKGDYSQKILFLGEFSEAFNIMTNQLKERELKMREEARVMNSYNHLLLDLIERSDEEILVTSGTNEEIIYYSKGLDKVPENDQVQRFYQTFIEKKKEYASEADDNFEWTWEIKNQHQRYYKILSGPIEWEGQKAYAHILREVTNEKLREEKLTEEANRDELTQIGNRHFFFEKMKEFLQSGRALVVCYCDLDHLKYVNDHFGHNEGDWYLQYFVEIVKKHIRQNDLFARLGGDEFCIVFQSDSLENIESKMQGIQKKFIADISKEYPKNFSWGMYQISEAGTEMSISDILEKADVRMYEQKRRHTAEFMV